MWRSTGSWDAEDIREAAGGERGRFFGDVGRAPDRGDAIERSENGEYVVSLGPRTKGKWMGMSGQM